MDDFELPAAEGQDELWLVSYADLLTLLVGFFVLIIASVPLKQARFERIVASLNGTRSAPLQNLREDVEQLVARTPALRDRVVAREDASGLGIEFKDALLFDSGSADLRDDAKPVVAEVAKLLRTIPGRAVTIEGHTDEQRVRGGPFHSNWELSSQRAINVLAALQAEGVPAQQLSARAFADTKPLDTTSPLDVRRTRNRRVVIRVE